MELLQTPLNGAWIIDINPHVDERGLFARTYCEDQFHAHRLETHWPQCSVSFNCRQHTLRGMHYQRPPYEECKLVRCTQGAIFDVIIDLRPTSATYKQWFGAELNARNRRALYIPKGFAHGFLTLTDDTEIFYQISERYVPDASAGIRWNDPAFNIQWPLDKMPVISERDRDYPDWRQELPK